MPGMLSERIAALRKERGLTQEQLGKMAGVSSQAVGKWEKGGAPDVELLPVLSRQLGVTMDALFGLEGGEQVDVEDAVGRWLRGFPNKERMGQFCRLVWASVKYFLPDGLSLPEIGYLETCQPDLGDDDRLMLSQCWGGDGILLDIHAEDLSFVTLWPKPEKGYAQWFAPKSEYRRLFALLARPGCLELLEYLHSRKLSYFSPIVAAKHLKMPRETAEELLDALAERSILRSVNLEVEDGEVKAYRVAEPLKLVPFLYLTRCFMQSDLNSVRLGDWEPPLGPDEIWRDTKEKKQHEGQ
ncbi:MAG: helix-turn-helix transcriptional regulator [Oscillospiraceae bacterium]|nr:helix-turn-helix transcriptional regulator [Oscillospiraceae bacterium]